MTDNIQEKVEDKVIDCINSEVSGRIIISKPQDSNTDAGLVLEKRGDYFSKKIYLQVNLLAEKNKFFAENISEEKVKPAKDLYLVFLHFDEVLQKISDKIWLIPYLEFKNVSADEKTHSRFAMDKKDLGMFLFNAFGKSIKPDHSRDYLKKNIT